MKNFKKNFSLAIIIVLGLSLLSVTSLASASLTSYNNVQINIQTSNIQSGYFTVSAFNMTGYQNPQSKPIIPPPPSNFQTDNTSSQSPQTTKPTRTIQFQWQPEPHQAAVEAPQALHHCPSL